MELRNIFLLQVPAHHFASFSVYGRKLDASPVLKAPTPDVTSTQGPSRAGRGEGNPRPRRPSGDGLIRASESPYWIGKPVDVLNFSRRGIRPEPGSPAGSFFVD